MLDKLKGLFWLLSHNYLFEPKALLKEILEAPYNEQTGAWKAKAKIAVGKKPEEWELNCLLDELEQNK